MSRLQEKIMAEEFSFQSPQELKDCLKTQKYIANDEIGTILYLSQQLGKPVLAEGPAGVGKTELAKALAGATDRELVRLQCYEGCLLYTSDAADEEDSVD